MRSLFQTIAVGTAALLTLGACTVNTAPPPVAAAPAPVVVQTPAPQPAPGTVVVPPPRAY